MFNFPFITGLFYRPIAAIINQLAENEELSLDKIASEFPDFKVEADVWDKLSEKAKKQLLRLGFRKD